MNRLLLPAGLLSELDWKEQEEQVLKSSAPLIWEFDFEFSEPQLFLNDSRAFHAYVLALSHFKKTLWNTFSHKGTQVILYRGSPDLLTRVVTSSEEDSLLEKATELGIFFHRLSTLLPDEASPYLLFEESSSLTPAQTAHLLSKERFQHLHLSLEENKLPPVGVLLPPDHLWTDEISKDLDLLLSKVKPIRVIPEKFLSEMWYDLDRLIVIETAVTPFGHRQLKGFEIAGGEILFLSTQLKLLAGVI